MYRATTPKHTFRVPFETSLIDEMIITYAQRGVVVLEKRLADVELTSYTISVTLTQEETNLFTRGDTAKVQLRIKSGEYVHASSIMEVSVKKVLNDEVM